MEQVVEAEDAEEAALEPVAKRLRLEDQEGKDKDAEASSMSSLYQHRVYRGKRACSL